MGQRMWWAERVSYSIHKNESKNLRAVSEVQESIKVCKALALNATQYGVARPDMIVKQIERVADDLGLIVTWFLFTVNLSVNEGTLLITDIVDWITCSTRKRVQLLRLQDNLSL